MSIQYIPPIPVTAGGGATGSTGSSGATGATGTTGVGLTGATGATGASGVTSVSNADGTLTISPTTGAVVASLNLGHANTWTGQQTFNTSTAIFNVAPTFSTMTLGSVLFAGTGGLLTQNNAAFSWDNSGNTLSLKNSTASQNSLYIENTANGVAQTMNYKGSAATTTNQGAFQEFQLNGVQGADVGINSPSYPGSGILAANDFTIQSFLGKLDFLTRGAFDIVFATNFTGGSSNERVRIKSTGTMLFAAGTTAAGSAPVKLTSGALMTTAEAGAVEFLTDKAYFTITTGAARKELALVDAALTSGRVPYVTTNGRLLDSANLVWDNTNVYLGVGGTPGYKVHAQGNFNGQTAMAVTNLSTGTAAYGGLFALNSANYFGMFKLSTGYTTAGLLVAGLNAFLADSGGILISTPSSQDVILAAGGTATTNESLRVSSAGNVSVGNAAIATTATNGFLYLPSCAGPPTGVPTAITGRIPIVVDSTNSKAYIRSGGVWVALN